jgi:hypothetical protein
MVPATRSFPATATASGLYRLITLWVPSSAHPVTSSHLNSLDRTVS